MFCEKCGTEIPAGSSFCPACGTKVEAAPPAGAMPQSGSIPAAGAMPQSGSIPPAGVMPDSGSIPQGGYAYQGGYAAPQRPAKKKSNTGIIIGAIAAVLVIAAVAGVMLLGKPYKKPVDTLFKAYNTNNFELLESALSPDMYLSWDRDYVENYDRELTYTISYVEHPKGDDLSYYKNMYGVSDCYSLTVDYGGEDSYGDYMDFSEVFIVGKANGKWRIYDIY